MTLVLQQLKELAFLSVREAIRKRLVYFVIIISILFLLIDFNCERNFSQAVSLEDNHSIDSAITFFFISFWNMLIALIIPSALIADEMENKTYTMILARPVHRMTYLIGKSLGVLGIVGANILFVLIIYSLVNGYKGVWIQSLWLASGVMLINYILLILLVVFITVNINRTAGIMISASILIFSTFVDLNLILMAGSAETLSIWKKISYWLLPQFGTVFLYGTSFIAKMEWNLDYGLYGIFHSLGWIILLFFLIHITFSRKELN